MRCYRLQPPAEDPQRLLDPGLQFTQPWGGSDNGERCDKCQGSGRTGYECWSCLLTGTNPACPACHGRVRWEAKCPVCRGGGQVDGSPRRGLSAFPTAEALYRYLLVSEADLVGTLVELEADLAEDIDFDADQGAVLVIPTSIASTRAVEPESIPTIRSLSER
ncbi:MAG: hypothetical protein ACM3UX_00420 [Candidatus Woesearchaeota archaeon]